MGAFCIPFRPLWHHFWILFRCRLFHDFRMPFWITFGSQNEKSGAGFGITFSKKNHVFSRSRFRAGIFINFDEFWMEFGWILIDFSRIVGPFRISFAKCLTSFASVLLMLFRTRCVSILHNIRHCFHPCQHRSNTLKKHNNI